MDGYEAQDAEDRGVLITNATWNDISSAISIENSFRDQIVTADEVRQALGFGTYRPEHVHVEFEEHPRAWPKLNRDFLDDFDWERTAYPG